MRDGVIAWGRFIGVGPSRYAVDSGDRYAYVNTEARALVARMIPRPNAARKALIDSVWTSLKAEGLTGIDCLYTRAAHSAQASLLNWMSDAFTASPINSPVFTVDRGWTFDGATSYLDTNYDPTTAGGNFSRNSACMGAWVRSVSSDVASTTSVMGNAAAFIRPRAFSTRVAGRMNSSSTEADWVSPATHLGLTTIDRNADAANLIAYRDGVALGSEANASAVSTSGTIFVGAINTGTVAAQFYAGEVLADFIAPGLGATKQAAIHTILADYKAAVGA